MYTIIDAECILANLLQRYEKVTVGDLNRTRATIEKAVTSVYVDVTKNSLIRAINRRPEMFVWEEDVFRRLKEWPVSEVEEFFNWRIPADIRLSVLKVIDGVTM
jgi:hypothetical protein